MSQRACPPQAAPGAAQGVAVRRSTAPSPGQSLGTGRVAAAVGHTRLHPARLCAEVGPGRAASPRAGPRGHACREITVPSAQAAQLFVCSPAGRCVPAHSLCASPLPAPSSFSHSPRFLPPLATTRHFTHLPHSREQQVTRPRWPHTGNAKGYIFFSNVTFFQVVEGSRPRSAYLMFILSRLLGGSCIPAVPVLNFCFFLLFCFFPCPPPLPPTTLYKV